MVIASPFRGLRPRNWEALDHLQPRSKGFDPALALAAADLDERRADGRLVLDPGPTGTLLWIDEDLDATTRTTAGVVLASNILAGADDRILAHERTFDDPVARRIRTRNRLAVESVPSLLILREPSRVLTELINSRQQPGLELQRAGTRQFARILDEDVAAELATALKGTSALIADGHHRIAAAAGADALAFGTALTWLVSAEHHPRLHPVHRTLGQVPIDARRRLARAGVDAFDCDPEPLPEHPVLVLPDGALGLRVGAPNGAVARALLQGPRVLRNLPVTLGHHVLHDVLGVGHRRTDMQTLTDASEAVHAVADRRAEGALLACGPSLDQVWAAADEDVLMPPKATWFAPKPASGAVLRPLADD